jgi:hypothetical protein
MADTFDPGSYIYADNPQAQPAQVPENPEGYPYPIPNANTTLWGILERQSLARRAESYPNQEIANLRALKAQFVSPGDFITLWLINKQMRLLQSRPGLTEPGVRTTKKDLPIPDWLKQYIEPPQTAEVKKQGTFTEYQAPWWQRGSTLKPMGAQAQLNLEEQGQLQGYQQWVKAGAPTKFSEGYLQKLAGQPDYWGEYIKQSEELFPTQVGWLKAKRKPMAQ